MKRSKLIIVALIMVASLLTACSSKAKLTIGQVLGAPHGERSFSVTTVVMDGDKILLAYIDEYQYLASATFEGVPNSETFTSAGSIAEGFVLGSKRVNNVAYSKNMAANGGATKTLVEGYDAIQKYAVGKKIADLETLVAKTSEEVIDAVSSATLADTANYLKEIVAAAKVAKYEVEYEGKTSELKLNQVDGAPHGTRSFSVVSVLTDGKKVVLAYIDEYQFLASATFTGVPNSANFTKAGSVAEGFVLGSKRVNNEAYSKNMAANGGATKTLVEGYDAIQAYAAGKSATDLETLVAKSSTEVIDAVSSATLTDTQNYLKEIIRGITETK